VRDGEQWLGLLWLSARKPKECGRCVNRMSCRCSAPIDPVSRAGVRPRRLGQSVRRQCQCRRMVVSVWRWRMGVRGRWTVRLVKRHTVFRGATDKPLPSGRAFRLIHVVCPRQLAGPPQSSCEVYPRRLLFRAHRVEGWRSGDDFGSYIVPCVRTRCQGRVSGRTRPEGRERHVRRGTGGGFCAAAWSLAFAAS
jgi:hypothetical protein